MIRQNYDYYDMKEFRKIFNLDLHDYWDIYGLDIIKLDDFIAPPDGISLKDKILSDYGEDAVKLIKRLLSPE